jgi:hypothetical protein
MKKLLLAVAATAVVVGGGVVATNHYDKYQNKQHKAQVSAVEQAKQTQAKADQQKQNALVTANAALEAECQKGVAAYAKLPLTVQRVVPKPVCPPATPAQ